MGDVILQVLTVGVAVTSLFTLGSVGMLAIHGGRWAKAKREESLSGAEELKARQEALAASARAANEVGRRLASSFDPRVGDVSARHENCTNPACPVHGQGEDK